MVEINTYVYIYILQSAEDDQIDEHSTSFGVVVQHKKWRKN